MQLRAATVLRPWAEAKGTLPMVPMLSHPPVLDEQTAKIQLTAKKIVRWGMLISFKTQLRQ